MNASVPDGGAQGRAGDAAAPKRGLSAKAIKWIAMVAMVIDHAAIAVVVPLLVFGYFPDLPLEGLYEAMRIIGRISFPLFVYLIVESFFHTRNRRRFVAGLFAFALISELPFDAALVLNAWGGDVTMWYLLSYQNVFFTLGIGVLCLMASEYAFHGGPALVSEMEVQKEREHGSDDVHRQSIGFSVVMVFLITVVGCGLAHFLCVDYGVYGVLAIVFAYLMHKAGLKNLEIFGIALPLVIESPIELWALLDAPVILAANGERGNIRHKWPYYAFYPAHLAVLAGIKLLIMLHAGVL